MSETKHTPGPWLFEPHGGYGHKDPFGGAWPFGYISTSTPQPIFELSPVLKFKKTELEANARLIAAAPEMLEALKAVDDMAVLSASGRTIKEYAIPVSVLEQVIAAIAKAEGRHV